MGRTTPKGSGRKAPSGYRRHPTWVKIAVWACLVAVLGLVLADALSAAF